jgi:mannose-1-phosphate guanylyltransferase
MLEEAVNRIQPLVGDLVFVSTSNSLLEVISDACVVPRKHVFAEPARRNTLGALVWVVANLIAQGYEDSSVAVVTADHKIGKPDRFVETVKTAMEIAEQTSGLVTLGIQPTRPETGFGYIEVNRDVTVQSSDGRTAYGSKRFLEKPSVATATAFLSGGNHLWNSGMFFFTVSAFLRELGQTNPEAFAILQRTAESLKKSDLESATVAFEMLPNLSIDFAMMEKASSVYVVPSDFPWDDLGTWDALERSLEPDEQGNFTQGRVLAIDSSGCVIYNEGGPRVIGVIGLSDLVVVATADAVLVCPKSEAQRVKQIAAAWALEAVAAHE